MTTKSNTAVKPARKTKAATVSQMLTRDKGATLGEIAKATGWQAHSCRAFLTGQRKKGAVVMKEERDGKTAYRIQRVAARPNIAASAE